MNNLNDKQKELGALFGRSREAVLGVRDGLVFFANEAAIFLLNRDPTELALEAVLPGLPAAGDPAQLVARTTLDDREITVSIVRMEEYALLTVPREENAPFTAVPRTVLGELRAASFTLKMAVDQIVARFVIGHDPLVESYTSILYHSYYSMLHFTESISSICLLADGTMPITRVPTDLGVLCSQLIETVQYLIGDRAADVKFTCAPDDMTALLDREKLDLLLLALLENSLLSTPPGGRISLTLRRRRDQLILSLDDTGAGIPREPFSSDPSALGAGLCIARGIAELHGGTLLVTTGEDGTSVRVVLPAGGQDALPLRDVDTAPREGGMQGILTELAAVLDRSVYVEKHFD